jgi:hypothetical protein
MLNAMTAHTLNQFRRATHGGHSDTATTTKVCLCQRNHSHHMTSASHAARIRTD